MSMSQEISRNTFSNQFEVFLATPKYQKIMGTIFAIGAGYVIHTFGKFEGRDDMLDHLLDGNYVSINNVIYTMTKLPDDDLIAD